MTTGEHIYVLPYSDQALVCCMFDKTGWPLLGDDMKFEESVAQNLG